MQDNEGFKDLLIDILCSTGIISRSKFHVLAISLRISNLEYVDLVDKCSSDWFIFTLLKYFQNF